MRAAVCREFGSPLTIEEITVGEPGPGEVRVDIHAVAICHSDITYASGSWGGELPSIYGHEAAGVIESVGTGVENVAPGDRVIVGLLRSCGECYHCVRAEEHLCIGSFDDTPPFADGDGQPVLRGLNTGAFAERTIVHRSQVVAAPATMAFPSASLLACGVLTGFGAVTTTAAVEEGATVAVIGVGGVGLGAVQGAVDAKAATVIGVDLVDEKLVQAMAFGAGETVNGGAADAAQKVRDLTGGIGPDYVFVTVGAAAAVDQAMSMVWRGGAVVLVGMPASGVMTEFETVEFANDSQRLIGSKMGSGRMAVDVPSLIERYQAGSLKLDEMVSATYPIERINDAIEEVRAGRVIRNVIVMCS